MNLQIFDSDFLKAKSAEYLKMLDDAGDELEQARNDIKMAQVDKDMAKAKFRAVWLEFGRYFELIEADIIPIEQHKARIKKMKKVEYQRRARSHGTRSA